MEHTVAIYKKINLIFAGIILGIFLYSGIFDHKKSNFPIPSNYGIITGEPSLSTGLSRSFSAIIRLEFYAAKQYNPYGISLFVFFLLQFFFRAFYASMSLKLSALINIKKVIAIDAIVSISLFIVYFQPFIKDVFHR